MSQEKEQLYVGEKQKVPTRPLLSILMSKYAYTQEDLSKEYLIYRKGDLTETKTTIAKELERVMVKVPYHWGLLDANEKELVQIPPVLKRIFDVEYKQHNQERLKMYPDSLSRDQFDTLSNQLKELETKSEIIANKSNK
jgi:hypothetical protein